MTSTTEAVTYEKVWATIQATAQQMKETDLRMQETEQQIKATAQLIKENKQGIKELKESMKETDRHMQETDRRMKETDRRIGELGNRFGELAEHLVAPSIKEKFNALYYTFDKCSQNVDIADAQDRYSGAEIDILLENGDVAIAVEVKARALTRDVDRHLERMEVLRRWADRHDDKRKFLGAVAGAIMPDEVRKYALKAGFYVIEQTGDTVAINVPGDFKPREW
jgi:hypothetical protein